MKTDWSIVTLDIDRNACKIILNDELHFTFVTLPMMAQLNLNKNCVIYDEATPG